MAKCRAEIPAVDGVRRPGLSNGRFLVDHDACAIVDEHTVDLGVGRQEGVGAGLAEQIEGDDGLREEAVLEVEREVAVSAAKAGDEVVFKRADGALGCVAMVDVWRGKMEVNLGAVHELL